MKFSGDFPIRGDLRWLTPEEGGRSTGYPATPEGEVFATTGYVESARDHVASILIDTADKRSWTSTARAQWLVPEHAPRAEIGDIITVTDGARTIANLIVTEIERF